MYQLSSDKSDFLHFVRWIAALLVVIGHVDMYLGLFGEKYKTMKAAFGYLGVHAHAAVIVFFVMSGYVIAYSTDRKSSMGDYSFRSYFLDRWSRIYSVVLAAIGFTLALDCVGGVVSTAYDNPALIPQDGIALRLMANLFSMQGIWGYRIQLGSNPALWSVGYEFIFYMLFGVLYFRKRLFRRAWNGVILMVVALGVIGWQMAAYFSIWLMGVAAYYVPRYTGVKWRPISAWLLIATIIIANHVIVYQNILVTVEVVRDFTFALVIAVIFSFDVKKKEPLFKQGRIVNKYMADFSYSIYAFHTPIVFFGCSLVFETWVRTIPFWYTGLMLVTVSILVGWVFSHLTESRRTHFRKVADQILRQLGI